MGRVLTCSAGSRPGGKPMRVLTGIELRTVSGGAMAARPVNLRPVSPRPVVRELEELIVLVRILVKDLGGRGMTPPRAQAS
jgi:hypothetical protein